MIKKILEFKWRMTHKIVDFFFEKKLNIDTGGKAFIDQSKSIYGDANGYAPTRYIELMRILKHLYLNKNDVIVDLGRVLNCQINANRLP